jgi:hypothetical protein
MGKKKPTREDIIELRKEIKHLREFPEFSPK